MSLNCFLLFLMQYLFCAIQLQVASGVQKENTIKITIKKIAEMQKFKTDDLLSISLLLGDGYSNETENYYIVVQDSTDYFELIFYAVKNFKNAKMDLKRKLVYEFCLKDNPEKKFEINTNIDVFFNETVDFFSIIVDQGFTFSCYIPNVSEINEISIFSDKEELISHLFNTEWAKEKCKPNNFSIKLSLKMDCSEEIVFEKFYVLLIFYNWFFRLDLSMDMLRFCNENKKEGLEKPKKGIFWFIEAI
jgi:hypothetical protein